MSDGFLFREFEIYAVVESQKLEVKKKIQSIPSATVLGASETDLVQSLFDEFRLNVNHSVYGYPFRERFSRRAAGGAPAQRRELYSKRQSPKLASTARAAAEVALKSSL